VKALDFSGVQLPPLSSVCAPFLLGGTCDKVTVLDSAEDVGEIDRIGLSRLRSKSPINDSRIAEAGYSEKSKNGKVCPVEAVETKVLVDCYRDNRTEHEQ
jgi:hypothetical protein